MTRIRYVETSDLPAGYDASDLIATGITPDEMLKWIGKRLRPGYPPPEPRPTAVPETKKSPGTEGAASGARGATTGERDRADTIAPQRTASTRNAPHPPMPATVSRSGNVSTIQRPAPQPAVDPDFPPQYSDDSMADVFAERHSEDLLFVAPWKRWMLWSGSLWQHDETLRATDLTRRVCREGAIEATQNPDLASKARSIATQLSSARTISNVERLARSDRRLAATATQWDHNPWVLNTPGGIVELQTGQLRPARKDDFVTKTTSVTPGGNCPVWQEFLRTATDGDDELIAYLRRMAGYCLTGITREHAMFFVYGTGGNGKGTFLNTMNEILKSYSKPTSMEVFVEQKFSTNGDTANVAGMMGARIVLAQETQEGKKWNEARLKEMTGGDPVTARFLGANPFTYTPQFKLVFAGNHKPALRHVDEAIKRRFNLIPFTVTVPAHKKDLMLPDKLRAEASGILQWAIDGCLDWQANFLAPPERVQVATDEYFVEEDTLAAFFDECCVFDSKRRVKTTDLYLRYGRWCESSGEYTLPRKRWLQQLAHRNMQSLQISGAMQIEGVGLRESESNKPYRERQWDD